MCLLYSCLCTGSSVCLFHRSCPCFSSTQCLILDPLGSLSSSVPVSSHPSPDQGPGLISIRTHAPLHGDGQFVCPPPLGLWAPGRWARAMVTGFAALAPGMQGACRGSGAAEELDDELDSGAHRNSPFPFPTGTGYVWASENGEEEGKTSVTSG